MTKPIESETSTPAQVVERESHPDIGRYQPPHDNLCANPRCRKGLNGTRGTPKSLRAKYCSAYCRVDVCRRNRPKPEQIEKPGRRRRRDAKYSSHSEGQRAYQARHRPPPLPEAIKDYLQVKADTAKLADKPAPKAV